MTLAQRNRHHAEQLLRTNPAMSRAYAQLARYQENEEKRRTMRAISQHDAVEPVNYNK